MLVYFIRANVAYGGLLTRGNIGQRMQPEIVRLLPGGVCAARVSERWFRRKYHTRLHTWSARVVEFGALVDTEHDLFFRFITSLFTLDWDVSQPSVDF